MENLITKLTKVQAGLKAPKGQFNKFGNYAYRSCEDILEAVKPLLLENGLLLTITDDLVMVGNRIYIKATVKVTDGKNSVENTAFAREEESKKGMDGSQVTGASSSYARKYALNGMFCIDDTKDSDATNTHGKEAESKPNDLEKILKQINQAKTLDELGYIHKSRPELHHLLEFMNALSAKKKQIKDKK